MYKSRPPLKRLPRRVDTALDERDAVIAGLRQDMNALKNQLLLNQTTATPPVSFLPSRRHQVATAYAEEHSCGGNCCCPRAGWLSRCGSGCGTALCSCSEIVFNLVFWFLGICLGAVIVFLLSRVF